MTQRRRLVDAITDYLGLLKIQGAGKSTLRNKGRTLGTLVRVAGNIYVTDLDLHHFEGTVRLLATPATAEENQTRRAQGMSPRTGRNERSLRHDEIALKGFADWAADHGYLSYRKQRLVLKEYFRPATQVEVVPVRRVLPVKEWPAVIEAAGRIHPRARMMTVLGLVWGRRASEIPLLRFRHIDLQMGEALITNVKSRREMQVPVDGYMADELRAWSAWLLEHMAATGRGEPTEVDPDWYVIPSRLHGRDFGRGTFAMSQLKFWPVDPTQKVDEWSLVRDVHKVLKAHGWDDLKGEGMHTFRRSAATAWDEIGDIQVAQHLLGHKTLEITQRYTQNRAGIRRMKEAFGNNPYGLAPTPEGDNVIDLRSRRREAS